MSILLALSLLSLFCTRDVLGSVVKRAPVTWSLEQCHSVELLASQNQDKAPLECARISVPLDYADSTKGTIGLQLVRIPASQQPSKGGIFINPGGPGGAGTAFMGELGTGLVQKFGSDWDLVSWDPRAVGSSEPSIIDLTPAELNDFWGETIHPGQYESHGNLTSDEDATFFRNQASLIDQGLKKFDEAFKTKNGANLTYIGTTSNVRDIVTMADELYGSDKDINFYGISYGTYMGYMLTQMYPNRMGKVILDGVMNPQSVSQYYPILSGDEQIGDAPETLKGFYNTCALAGPSRCPLSRRFPTPEAIQGAVNQYLENAFKTWNANGGGPSYNMLVAQIVFPVLYLPEQWPLASIALSLGLNGSMTESTALMKASMEENKYKRPYIPNLYSRSVWGAGMKRDLERRQVDENYVGYSWDSDYTIVTIQCSDSPEVQPDIVTTPRVFEEIIRIGRTLWPLAPSIVSAGHFCHRYTSRAVGRYSGPWDVQPKNVVLVIGNQADPVTPFRNAQLVTRLLGGKGRLVQQAGYGHTSLALNSTCTSNTIKQYLQGTIPDDKGNDGPDVSCDVDQGPFGLPGNTQWNITTSQNGDNLTSGPDDPGLVNFPGLTPPAAIGGQSISSSGNNGNSQTGAASMPTLGLGWWTASLVLGVVLFTA